jgi:hypothetical protein
MGVGYLYFKHFSVKLMNQMDHNYARIIVSLADTSFTLSLIENLLAFGRDYDIDFRTLKPVFFKWGSNKKKLMNK